MSNLSLMPLFRRSIGFDRLNDLFDHAMLSEAPHYPAYNIEKVGDDHYRIVVAATGFNQDELTIDLENQVLNLSSMKYFSFLASFGKLAYLDLSNKPL